MGNKPVVYVHIKHKLYQADGVKTCSNCGSQVPITSEEKVITPEEKATVRRSCNNCDHDVTIIFRRVKPKWVKLVINQKDLRAESIQTCNTPWCQQEFLIEWIKDLIEYDRAEEWHAPVTCPYCLEEHWINLYELNES